MSSKARYLALCGGVGGAKLADGLARVLPADRLTIAVNVGDDFEHLGLTICPDLDTVCYGLAGVENPDTGWGRRGETWNVMSALDELGGETWFKLGDRDLALHLLRLQGLRSGDTLSAITAKLCRRLGVTHCVRPISDQPIRTYVETLEGVMPFQRYFVERRCEPSVLGFRFEGAREAKVAPDVQAALDDSALAGIVICPSNPYVSIGPMLAVPGLKEYLMRRRVPVLAVSPIVGGRALKGPAAKMMTELGVPATSLEIARHYGTLIDALLVDTQDASERLRRAASDPEFVVADSVMRSREDREALARACLDWFQARRSTTPGTPGSSGRLGQE